MASKRDKVINEIKRLIRVMERNGLSINAAYLFGSYAKGKTDKWSDIDVAIVSDDFSGIRFYDVEKLISVLKKYNSFIEFHPFRTVDFNPETDLFTKEILENSLKIK